MYFQNYGELSFTGHIPQVSITGHCFIDTEPSDFPFDQKQHFG